MCDPSFEFEFKRVESTSASARSQCSARWAASSAASVPRHVPERSSRSTRAAGSEIVGAAPLEPRGGGGGEDEDEIDDGSIAFAGDPERTRA